MNFGEVVQLTSPLNKNIIDIFRYHPQGQLQTHESVGIIDILREDLSLSIESAEHKTQLLVG